MWLFQEDLTLKILSSLEKCNVYFLIVHSFILGNKPMVRKVLYFTEKGFSTDNILQVTGLLIYFRC